MFMSDELDLETYLGAYFCRLMQLRSNKVPFDRWEFLLNNVVDQIHLPFDKKIHFLLNIMETYILDRLISQTNPINPMTLTYEDIASIMRNKYNNISENYAHIFNLFTRLQVKNESIRDFYFSLRILAELCNFRDGTDKIIRTQFIMGLMNKNIRDRLKKMDDKNLEDIISTAEQMQLEESSKNLEFD
ncbi:hypothetical protein M0802_011135 [Mischocyttarus mexicanus]|nr:hypothetical protein M0802_011135 [Mischocyttarus mexicanus]